MRRTLTIGEYDVDMVANGMTPVIYKRIFRKDFLVESQKKDTDMTLFQELGFVMAMQAQKPVKELMEGLTESDYWEWLEKFGALDVLNSVDKIFELYANQTVSTSTAKKKRG